MSDEDDDWFSEMMQRGGPDPYRRLRDHVIGWRTEGNALSGKWTVASLLDRGAQSGDPKVWQSVAETLAAEISRLRGQLQAHGIDPNPKR